MSGEMWGPNQALPPKCPRGQSTTTPLLAFSHKKSAAGDEPLRRSAPERR